MSDQQKFSRKDMEELARFIEGKDDKDPNRFKNIVDNFIKNCKQERESINVKIEWDKNIHTKDMWIKDLNELKKELDRVTIVKSNKIAENSIFRYRVRIEGKINFFFHPKWWFVVEIDYCHLNKWKDLHTSRKYDSKDEALYDANDWLNCKQEEFSKHKLYIYDNNIIESISASVNTVDGCIILNTIDSHAVESKEVGVSCSIKYSKPIKSK